jgi:hypothetical protein
VTITLDALGIAEDAIVAALNAQQPRNSGSWSYHAPDTTGPLLMPHTGASRVTRLYTAQHQAADMRRFMGLARYEGDVLVKCWGRTATEARAGLIAIAAAMLALQTYAPAGSLVRARFNKHQPLPGDVVPVRGLLYTVTAHT